MSREQFDREGLYRSRQEGRCGGGAEDGKEYFVKPTAFVDVNNDMRIAREEIFGPVAATIPFKHENDAVF